jgi:hypothetical protein
MSGWWTSTVSENWRNVSMITRINGRGHTVVDCPLITVVMVVKDSEGITEAKFVSEEVGIWFVMLPDVFDVSVGVPVGGGVEVGPFPVDVREVFSFCSLVEVSVVEVSVGVVRVVVRVVVSVSSGGLVLEGKSSE